MINMRNLEKIKSKLIVEHAKNLSDGELERCLSGTVVNTIDECRVYRDYGILKYSDIKNRVEKYDTK